MTLVLVRSLPAYRQIPVCGSFIFGPTARYRQQTLHTPRFGPSRYIREGRRRRHLSLCILYRFHLSLRKELAANSRSVFHSALDLYRWCLHEQNHFQVYSVRSLSRGLYEL